MDSHLSYTITRDMWLSIDYLRRWGGGTIINGIFQHDEVRDTTVGISARTAFSPATALEFTYRNDVVTRTTKKNTIIHAKSSILMVASHCCPVKK